MRRFPISWDKTLCALGFRRNVKRIKRDHYHRRNLQLETLESRELLSGEPSLGIEENHWVFNGSLENLEGTSYFSSSSSSYELVSSDEYHGNGALSLNGTRNFVIGDINDLYRVRSLSLWFKPNDTIGKQYLFQHGDDSNGIALRINGDAIEAAAVANGDAVSVTSEVTATAGRWHFAVLYFDNGELRLQVDRATNVATAQLSNTFIRMDYERGYAFGAYGYTAFGDDNTNSHSDHGFYNGLIDDFRIYRSYNTLSDEQIDEISSRKMGTHYWSFNTDNVDAYTSIATSLHRGAEVESSQAYLGGGALRLDGVDSYATINQPELQNSFDKYSISAWFYVDRDTGTQLIFEEGGTTNGIALRLNGSNLEGGLKNAGNLATVSISGVKLNTWHLAALTFDKGELSIYLDGKSNVYSDVGFDNVPPHSSHVNIGGENDGSVFSSSPGSFLSGAIDELKVYDNTVLHSNDIKLLLSSPPQKIVPIRIEAEKFTSRNSGIRDEWEIKQEIEGYSGAGYVQAVEDDNSPGFVANFSNETLEYSDGRSPRLDYNVHFPTAGIYYVWVRAIRSDGSQTGKDDSIHIGLDGKELDSSDSIQLAPTSFNSWEWSNRDMSNQRVTVNVDSSGMHTLNLWMREDGAKVDRILLSEHAWYTPDVTGPQANSSAPLHEGLVGHWTFDKAQAYSTHNNVTRHYTRSLAASPSTNWSISRVPNHQTHPGVLGYPGNSSIKFTSNTHRFYVNAGVSTYLEDSTLSIWFKLRNSVSINQELFSLSGSRYGLYHNEEGILTWGSKNPDDPRVEYHGSPLPSNNSEWINFTGVIDKTNGLMSAYINGDSAGWLNKSNQNAPEPIVGSALDYSFNGVLGSPSNSIGYLDDVKIYDRALSSDEVRVLGTYPHAENNNLIGEWSFDEEYYSTDTQKVFRNLFDSESHDANATATLEYLDFTQPGPESYDSNLAVTFPSDNTDGTVYLGQLPTPGSGNYTVSIWFKSFDTNSTQFIASDGNKFSSSEGWSLAIHGNQLTWRVKASDASSAPASITHELADNNWHHFVGVIDSSSGKLRGYLDGQSAGWSPGGFGANSDALPTSASISPTNGIRLGQRADQDPNYRLKGAIDGLRIYTGALTQADAIRLYTNNKTIAGDFNGDGSTEIILSNESLPEYGTNESVESWSVLEGNKRNWLVERTTESTHNVTSFRIPDEYHLIDYNGDGRDDLLGQYYESSDWYLIENSSFAPDNYGGKFIIHEPYSWSSAFDWDELRVGDFNGDGREDLATLTPSNTLLVFLSDGTGLNEPISFATLPAIVSPLDAEITIGDYNGDGKHDLWISEPGASTNSALLLSDSTIFNVDYIESPTLAWTNKLVGDFDGDGSDEIAGRTDNLSNWQVLQLGGQSETINAEDWGHSLGSFAQQENLSVGDINNDGKDDLIGIDAGILTNETGYNDDKLTFVSLSSNDEQVGFSADADMTDWFTGYHRVDSEQLADPQGPYQNVIDIFESVYNQVSLEFYPGLMKGPEATEQTKSANPWDQATLLMERLQESNYEAAIVTGLIVVEFDDLKAWLGTTSNYAAYRLVKNAFDDTALSTDFSPPDTGLSLEEKLNLHGRDVIFRHAWVQVKIPTETGYENVQIDPSWKLMDPGKSVSIDTSNSQFGYSPITGRSSRGRYDEFGFLIDADASQLPVEWYLEQSMEQLVSDQSGATLADLFRSRSIIQKSFSTLPKFGNEDSAPYQYLEGTTESFDSFSRLADDSRFSHHLSVTLSHNRLETNDPVYIRTAEIEGGNQDPYLLNNSQTFTTEQFFNNWYLAPGDQQASATPLSSGATSYSIDVYSPFDNLSSRQQSWQSLVTNPPSVSSGSNLFKLSGHEQKAIPLDDDFVVSPDSVLRFQAKGGTSDRTYTAGTTDKTILYAGVGVDYVDASNNSSWEYFTTKDDDTLVGDNLAKLFPIIKGQFDTGPVYPPDNPDSGFEKINPIPNAGPLGKYYGGSSILQGDDTWHQFEISLSEYFPIGQIINTITLFEIVDPGNEFDIEFRSIELITPSSDEPIYDSVSGGSVVSLGPGQTSTVNLTVDAGQTIGPNTYLEFTITDSDPDASSTNPSSVLFLDDDSTWGNNSPGEEAINISNDLSSGVATTLRIAGLTNTTRVGFGRSPHFADFTDRSGTTSISSIALKEDILSIPQVQWDTIGRSVSVNGVSGLSGLPNNTANVILDINTIGWTSFTDSSELVFDLQGTDLSYGKDWIGLELITSDQNYTPKYLLYGTSSGLPGFNTSTSQSGNIESGRTIKIPLEDLGGDGNRENLNELRLVLKSTDTNLNHLMQVSIGNFIHTADSKPLEIGLEIENAPVAKIALTGINIDSRIGSVGYYNIDNNSTNPYLNYINPNTSPGARLNVQTTHTGPSSLISSSHSNTYSYTGDKYVTIGLDANQYSTEHLVDLMTSINRTRFPNGEPSTIDSIQAFQNLTLATYWHQYNTSALAIDGAFNTTGIQRRVGSGVTTSERSIYDLSDSSYNHLQSRILPVEAAVDLPNGVYNALDLETGDFNHEAFQLVGWNASALENAVLEEIYNTESISTIRGLHNAFNNTPSTSRQTETDGIMVFERVSDIDGNPIVYWRGNLGKDLAMPEGEVDDEGKRPADNLQTLDGTQAYGPNNIVSGSNIDLSFFKSLLTNHVVEGENGFAESLWNTLTHSDNEKVTVIVTYLQSKIGSWEGSVNVADIIEKSGDRSTSYAIRALDGTTTEGGYSGGINSIDFLPPTLPPTTFTNQTFAGDPVAVANGNMFRDELDFTFPNLQIPLDFTRHYDAQGKFDIGLGLGWVHAFTGVLYLNNTDDNNTALDRVTWIRGDGSQHTFEWNSSENKYDIPTSLMGHVNISRSGSSLSEFIYKEKNGTTHSFDLINHDGIEFGGKILGRLSEISSRNGNTVEIDYESNNSVRVTSVKDTTANDRELQFNYSNASKVVLSKINEGATVEEHHYHIGTGYGVTGNVQSGRRLIHADPLPNADGSVSEYATSYGYYTPSHLASSSTDLRLGKMRTIEEPGHGEKHLYEYYLNGRAFRVKAITSAGADGAYFTSDDTSDDQIFTYNLFRNSTEFIDENGNVTTYHHRDDGLLDKQVHDDGSFVRYVWGQKDDPINAGLMLESIDETGASEIFEYYGPYDNAGTSYRRYGELKNSVTKDGVGTHFDYFVSSDSTWKHVSEISKTTTYPTDQVQVDSEGGITFTPPQNTQPIETSFVRDARGNLLSQIDALGNSSNYQRHGYGVTQSHLRGLIHADRQPNGTENSYEYDSAGNVTFSSTEDIANGKQFYDHRGNLTHSVDATGVGSQYTYDERGRLAESHQSRRDDYIDFSAHTLTDFGNQTGQANAPYSEPEILDGGRTLRLDGNIWRAIDLGTDSLVLTEDTVIEFDFKSTRGVGEGHTINFYKTPNTNDPAIRTIRLFGSQQVAAGNDTRSLYRGGTKLGYEIGDGWTHYRISLADAFADNIFDGSLAAPTAFRYLVFVNDDDGMNYDGGNSNNPIPSEGDSWFSNVRIYRESEETKVGLTTNTYDPSGRIKSTTDATNRTTTLEYDERGRLISTIAADSTRTTSLYDGVGNQILTLDQLGNETQFIYDNRNRVIQTIFADGSQVQSNFDGAGRITKSVDAVGNATFYEYDQEGRLSRTFGAIEYEGIQQPWELRQAYDSLGRLDSSIDEQGVVTKYYYDKLNRVTATEIFTDNTETDSISFAVTEYDANGNIISASVHDETDVASFIDFSAHTLTDFGNQTGQANAPYSEPEILDGGRTLRLDGNIWRAIDLGTDSLVLTEDTVIEFDFKSTRGVGEGHTINFYKTPNTNDPAIRTIRLFGSQQVAAGNDTRSLYRGGTKLGYEIGDGWTHYRISLADAFADNIFDGSLAAPTAFRYLVFVNDDDGMNYDGGNSNNPIPSEGDSWFSNVRIYRESEYKSPKVQTVRSHIDAYGRVVQVQNSDGTSTSTDYDAAGRIAISTDELGRQTTQSYDAYGRLERTTLPDPDGNGPRISSYTRYVLDSAGRVLEERTNGNQESLDGEAVVTFNYNSIGQVSERQDYYDGYMTSFSYDPAGRLIATTDALNSTSYNRYDKLGRVIESHLADPDGSGPLSAPVSANEYDDAGRLIRSTDPSGASTWFTYDSAGRLRTQSRYQAYAPYSSAKSTDGLATISLGFGDVPKGDYRISIKESTLQELLLLNAIGANLNQTSVLKSADTFPADISSNISFVEKVNNDGNTWHVLSDPASIHLDTGQDILLDILLGGDISNYEIPLDAIRIEHLATQTFNYDIAGNLTSQTDPLGRTTDFEYDKFGRVVKTSTPDPDGDGELVSLVTTTRYDDFGNVIEVVEERGGGGYERKTVYSYDDRNRLVEERVVQASVDLVSDLVTKYEYDAVGNLTTTINPIGVVSTTRYDAINLPTDEILGQGTIASVSSVNDKTPLLFPSTLPNYANNIDNGFGTTPAETSSDGLSLTLSGNAWKSLVLQEEYAIKHNTVLEFQIEYQGEVPYIVVGVEDDNNLSFADSDGIQGDAHFQIAGSYSAPFFDRSYHVGNDLDGTTTIYLPLGELTDFSYLVSGIGSGGLEDYLIDRLVFGLLDGRSVPDSKRGSVTFSNVRLYESDHIHTHYQYDTRGNLITSQVASDPRGIVSQYEYDLLGRQTSETLDSQGGSVSPSSSPSVRTWEYDAVGNLLKQTQSFSDETPNINSSFKYDRLHRQIISIGADPITGQAAPADWSISNNTEGRPFTSLEYDVVGNLVRSVDAESQSSNSHYDTNGNLVSALDGNGNETRYHYDSVGNLLAIEDAAGNTTHYTYDSLDRVLTETNELGDARVSTYDNQGNLSTVTDRNGRSRTFAYDSLDRPVLERWSDVPGFQLVWQYDDLGRIVLERDGGNFNSFKYDDLNKIITRRNFHPVYSASIDEPKVEYNYQYFFSPDVDSDGALVFHSQAETRESVQGTPLGLQRTYFDHQNRASRIIDQDLDNSAGPDIDNKDIFLNYHEDGSLQSIDRYGDLDSSTNDWQTNLFTSYQYDGLGRLKKIEHKPSANSNSPLRDYDYNYDAASRITGITIDSGPNRIQGYDNAGQLTSTDGTSITYDKNGNREAYDGSKVVTDKANRLVSDGTYTYEYDKEGNRTRRSNIKTGEVEVYTWDHRNRLTKVEKFTESNNLNIDFTTHTSSDFGGQSGQYVSDEYYEVLEEGRTLHLYSNIWRAIDLTSTPMDLSADTVIEFDFKSTRDIGEGHNLNFYKTANTNDPDRRTIRLLGSQHHSNNDYSLYREGTVLGYEIGDGWTHYRIDLAEAFADGTLTGEPTYNYLVFVNDDDGKNFDGGNSNNLIPGEGDSWFSNVRIYDREYPNSTLVENRTTYYHNADDQVVRLTTEEWTESDDLLNPGAYYDTNHEFRVYEGDDLSHVFSKKETSGAGIPPEGLVGPPPPALPWSSYLKERYIHGPAVDMVLAEEHFTLSGNSTSYWLLGDHQNSIRDIYDESGTLRKEIDYDSFGKIIDEVFYNQNGLMIQDPINFDFSESDLIAYDPGAQDGANDVHSTYSVLEDGNTLHLEGNTWKSINIDYEVTSSTYLTFEFKANQEGEIHAIQFDNDLNHGNGSDRFGLFGIEVPAADQNSTWVHGNLYNQYEEQLLGSWVTITIPIGQVFTGNRKYITFVNDNDTENTEGTSSFRNVRLYEPTIGIPPEGFVGPVPFVPDPWNYDASERPGAVEQNIWYAGRPWDETTEAYDFRARHYDPNTGRFLSEDPIGFAGGDANLYRYVGNNPVNYVDPSGLIQAGNPLVNLGLNSASTVASRGFDPYSPVSGGSTSVFNSVFNSTPSVSSVPNNTALDPSLGYHLTAPTRNATSSIHNVVTNYYSNPNIVAAGEQKSLDGFRNEIYNSSTLLGAAYDTATVFGNAHGYATSMAASPVIELETIETVYNNTSQLSSLNRAYVTGGTYLASQVGIRGIDDAFHTHDAVDGHVQSGFERAFDFGSGILQAAGPVASAVRAAPTVARTVESSSQVAYRTAQSGFETASRLRVGINTKKLTSQVNSGVPLNVVEVRLAPPKTNPLKAGEGQVGTYDDLIAAGSKGDNITPHHVPSANHMKQHGVSKGEGFSINMEHTHPGSGGRHRQTFTYGSQADVGLSPRDALGRGVRDARSIYQQDGLYDAYIRQQLQELIRLNKQAHPELFLKKPGG